MTLEHAATLLTLSLKTPKRGRVAHRETGEVGVIASVNSKYVFVNFDKPTTGGKACYPEDLVEVG